VSYVRAPATILGLDEGGRDDGYVYRSVLPCVPGAIADLAMRLLADGTRPPELVIAEVTVYFAATAAATFILERPLLAELIGYLRGRDRRLATA
jgi:hypothetical protein